MKTTTTTSTTYVPTGTNAEPNYREYCWYRLPCGICTGTNEFCPLGGGEIKVDFNKVTCDNSDWYVNLNETTNDTTSTGFSSKFTDKEADEILNNIFTWRPIK